MTQGEVEMGCMYCISLLTVSCLVPPQLEKRYIYHGLWPKGLRPRAIQLFCNGKEPPLSSGSEAELASCCQRKANVRESLPTPAQKGKEREEHIEEGNEMKVRKYGHEPAQTSSQAKRIGNRPTLFLELFRRTDRRKPINRLQTPLLEISLSL